jgi:hypothetical protein
LTPDRVEGVDRHGNRWRLSGSSDLVKAAADPAVGDAIEVTRSSGAGVDGADRRPASRGGEGGAAVVLGADRGWWWLDPGRPEAEENQRRVGTGTTTLRRTLPVVPAASRDRPAAAQAGGDARKGIRRENRYKEP